MLLKLRLIDQENNEPVVGANVFINNASLGSISDENGYFELIIPKKETQELYISHISYETKIIESETYQKLSSNVEIPLKRNINTIAEIELVGKRGKQWKRNLKKFRKGLLGSDKVASKCRILNPEVLRFSDSNGSFTATATDLLKLKNEYLGYDIYFLLNSLKIQPDGSAVYSGNGLYQDIAPLEDKRIKKRREQQYQLSLAHFLLSLQNSASKEDLRKKGYRIEVEKYIQGSFAKIWEPEPFELISIDSLTGYATLQFPEFLTVHHLNHKIKQSQSQKVSVSSAEQQRFGSNNTQTLRTTSSPAVSRIFKVESKIFFDQRGNIINKSAIKEYGFWAEQKLATSLPVDYIKFIKNEVPHENSSLDTLQIFLSFLEGNQNTRTNALKQIKENWNNSFIPPLLDILLISGDNFHQTEITKLLNEKSPQMEGDYYNGVQWLWQKPPIYGSYYSDFKARIYRNIDTRFFDYFNNRGQSSKIRLDEILWGGVKQDGIPPLRNLKMISANEATYLEAGDIIFGLVINNKAYTYPKRILAWHEFFTDEIDGKSVAGVYCTLCGTMIAYDTEVQGTQYNLGTSGFLYKSNKLMYDKGTQSLWSTLLGKPVLGPLSEDSIEMNTIPVITTTWKEWSSQYPDAKVLSLETGHKRNYSEGEAYKEYFGTDALMFPVPLQDKRLRNKARVLIPRIENYQADPLAISINFLKKHKMLYDSINGNSLLILSQSDGAGRVYATKDIKFQSYDNNQLLDSMGNIWQMKEDYLQGPENQKLFRIPSHEAFWFAWYNAFPNTRLVK